MKTNHNKNFLFFRIWFGFGAPLYFFGALTFLAFHSMPMALFLLLAYAWRIYDSFTTTCCRCPHYGTYNCGVQGKIASFFVKRKTDFLSKDKIKLHSYVDWIFIVVALIVYFQKPWLGFLASLWPVGAYFLVYKPKRFHGLLHKLES